MKPNGELDKILEDYIMQKNSNWWESRDKAKAQLKAYFLKQALDLIGADWEEQGDVMFDNIVRARNQVNAELRQAFKEKYR